MASPGHLVSLHYHSRKGPTGWHHWRPSPLRTQSPLIAATPLQTQGVQWMAPLAPIPSARQSIKVVAREAQRMAPLVPVPLVPSLQTTVLTLLALSAAL